MEKILRVEKRYCVRHRRRRPSAPSLDRVSVIDVRNRTKGSTPYLGLVAVIAAGALLLAGMIGAAFAERSGHQDYVDNCAECHGTDGKGKGPNLRIVPGINPPDLTLLSRRNGGTFPFQRVEDSVDGRKGIPSHKRFDMPFWGVTFQEPGKEFTPESDARVKARIDAVVRYLESIQQK